MRITVRVPSYEDPHATGPQHWSREALDKIANEEQRFSLTQGMRWDSPIATGMIVGAEADKGGSGDVILELEFAAAMSEHVARHFDVPWPPTDHGEFTPPPVSVGYQCSSPDSRGLVHDVTIRNLSHWPIGEPAFAVVTPPEPEPDPPLIDRELGAAEERITLAIGVLDRWGLARSRFETMRNLDHALRYALTGVGEAPHE